MLRLFIRHSQQGTDFIADLIDIAGNETLITGGNLPRHKAMGRHASRGDLFFQARRVSFVKESLSLPA
jgi:hypothetical protein